MGGGVRWRCRILIKNQFEEREIADQDSLCLEGTSTESGSNEYKANKSVHLNAKFVQSLMKMRGI